MSTLTDVYDVARRTLAACPAWQSWCGVTDEADAAPRVHVAEIPKAEMTADKLPRCRINERGFEQDNLGGQAGRLMRGELALTFFEAFDDGPNADTLEQQKFQFRDRIGEVLDDLHELSESGFDEYLFIRSIASEEPIDFPDREEGDLGRVIAGSFVIRWGPDGVSGGE